jgi:transcriptional regulator with XRE-family HTH domain
MYRLPPADFHPRAMAIVGGRIRQRRFALDWDQGQLGDRTGMAPAAISAIEKGRRNLTLQSLLKMAHALDVDPAELVRGLRPPGLSDPAMREIAREHERHEAQIAEAKAEAAARRATLHADHERRVTDIINSHR